MDTFEEENLVLTFTHVNEDGEVDYRDSIRYNSTAELRADSKAEREAKFQARYEEAMLVASTPTEPPIEE